MFPKPLTALKKENFVVNPVSNSAISLCASSTEFTFPKLSACLPLMVRDLKFSLCCFCLFLKNHGSYSFGCSATSLADFRESSVMFYKSLNIPSQSLSTEVVLVDGMLTTLLRISNKRTAFFLLDRSYNVYLFPIGL